MSLRARIAAILSRDAARLLEESRRREAALSVLLESLAEGVIALDANGSVVRMNRSSHELLGVGDAPPIPVDRLPPDPALREAIRAAIGGRVREPVELRLGHRVVAANAHPLPGGGAAIALFDLTALRRLETIRRDFVANVSHELRTPLTAITGYAETLGDETLPLDDRRHFTRTLLANAERMRRIIDDLLDLSRIESGGWTPEPARVDVALAAGDALSPARSAAHAKGLGLTLAIDPRAPTVDADPTAVRQILSNLTENAVRHTERGQVTVFTARGEGGSWLGVRDTGIGIPAEHLPRVFERFYRVDAGRSRAAGGTGLGLAIVRHLAEAHGGRAEVESAVGQGTTVRVFFPERRQIG